VRLRDVDPSLLRATLEAAGVDLRRSQPAAVP